MNRIPDGYTVEPHSPSPDNNSHAEAPFAPINYADLAQQRPERGPPVIEGVLREGAVGTLISYSKARKSWAVAALVGAAMTGGSWFGHNVTKGRVLLIDGELTKATIFWRLTEVFRALGVGSEVFKDLDVFDLRGRTGDALKALAWAAKQGPGYFKHIIVDPLSCFYPVSHPNDRGPRFNENDNADMRRLMDSAITFASATRAAVMIVHHASKGAQFEKAVADVGAGAGSLVRSVDAHLILRAHQEKDCIVLDGVVRDFAESPPTCWRWNFPTYSPALDLSPDNLAGKKPRKGDSNEFLAGGKATRTDWTAETFAEQFITSDGRTLARLQAEGEREGIKAHRSKALVDQAVALGLAYVWPGKPGMNGTPARYANISCPVTEWNVSERE